MIRSILSILVPAVLCISCAQDQSREFVSPAQYVSDVACWGRKKGTFEGIAVFAGSRDKSMYLLSYNCTPIEDGAILGIYDELGLMRIADDQMPFADYGAIERLVPNFVFPRPIPNKDTRAYQITMAAHKVEKHGFEYLEVDKILFKKPMDLVFWQLKRSGT